MKKTLLLDIDYTLIKPSSDHHDEMGEKSIPRPHLAEFLDRMREKYNIVLYTAGNSMTVANFLRALYHKVGYHDREFLHDLQLDALYDQNCPMVEYKKPGGTYIEIKSLESAAEELNIPIEELILLDDNPCYDHPHRKQIIQAEGFYGDENDDYLKRVEL